MTKKKINVIKEYFSDVDQTLVQMIISIPALFIFLTNMIFPKLCSLFRAKELTLAGLVLYVVGGCAAGQCAGRAAATTVMPLLSMALYLAQFTTPMILSIIGSSTPYFVASCSALIKEAVIQEK